MSVIPRYRPDDLRVLGTELLAGAGLERSKASAVARILLWYDAVGAPTSGIMTLGEWLDRISAGEFNPSAVGRVGHEHASTAVFEAGGGLPHLVLGRAAELASQKARETGVGLVRVAGLPEVRGPAAAVAADLAIGPYLGMVLGPGASQAAAVPSPDGAPAVFDSELAGGPSADRGRLSEALAPWSLLAIGGEVLVGAVAVAAFESLGAFHERVASALEGRQAPPGWIVPGGGEPHRGQAGRAGVPIAGPTEADLRRRAEAAGIAFPIPIGPGRPEG